MVEIFRLVGTACTSSLLQTSSAIKVVSFCVSRSAYSNTRESCVLPCHKRCTDASGFYLLRSGWCWFGSWFFQCRRGYRISWRGGWSHSQAHTPLDITRVTSCLDIHKHTHPLDIARVTSSIFQGGRWSVLVRHTLHRFSGSGQVQGGGGAGPATVVVSSSALVGVYLLVAKVFVVVTSFTLCFLQLFFIFGTVCCFTGSKLLDCKRCSPPSP